MAKIDLDMILSVLSVYSIFSILTLGAYWIDKRAAQQKRMRIPETTLLVLGVVGGWPGGLLAQQVLRHKTKKLSFQVQFWISVIVNLGTCYWIVTRGNFAS